MNNQLQATRDYHSVIERAAMDPNFDVDKLERLVAMQEASQQRSADQLFNEALSKAEAEMSVISTNANNPQTKSRYATFARLDGEIRPIYTGHGFGIQFNTEPMGEPNVIRVVGMLSNGMAQRRFQVDMPIVTQGIRGQDMMTRTHATMSAISYGKRALEIMMFNLAIGDDDDGNRAGGSYRPPAPAPAPRSMDELTDPHTGEVVDHVDPFRLEMHEGQTWAAFIEPLQRYLKHCRSIAEWDEWRLLNQDLLLKLKETKPQLFRLFEKNIEAKHEELTK
ncbi:ERF family protein [Bradyrhizobium septentrionale]|uniref:ERF family protein n=1 Tax=Bradyrhizobium septentrionale TaxID=1404411 RepID=A0A973VXD2_9BRAD|nr:ERF family protein [Bradyrhizobium septentrionale]UGY12487.1 ERF family protein [Bradyrhizobium septentrionale]UGY25033.1 ERF family protein [Bradyrhizobium septentrionale]